MATDLTAFEGVTYPETARHHDFVIDRYINLAEDNELSGEEITFLRLPDKCFVNQVQYDVEKVEGGVLTAEVGDQDGASNWFTGIDLNALGSGISTLITAGKYFATGPIFRLTVNNDADAAQIRIRVIASDLSARTSFKS